jgi:hypothetical protein
MKRTLSAAVVILTFAIIGAAQASCARHVETGGGLSFRLEKQVGLTSCKAPEEGSRSAGQRN